MLEPLTPAIVAVATLILNKAFEKTGEKLGETVSSQAAHLMQLIQRKSLPKSSAIVQADPNQPIDFGQAVLEVDAASTTDPELDSTVKQLAAIVQADPKLASAITTYAQALKQAPPTTVQNFGKLAENIQEIKAVFQGNTINQPTFNF